jgi:threonine/homoserine/homoserine lactone efflux protein
VVEAIGEILLLGVGVAVNPLAVVPAVMIVARPHGRARGLAFAAGLSAGLLLVGAVVLAVAPDGSDAAAPPRWASVLKLVLGVGLVLLAATVWRRRPRDGAEQELPSWLGAVDRLTPVRAFAMSFGLAAVNPKNLVLSVAAAASIAQTDATAAQQTGAFLVFVALGSLGVLLPVVAALVFGARADPALRRIQGFMIANSKVILALILLLIGVKLVGDAISGLAAV